jgi:hypothetical protein
LLSRGVAQSGSVPEWGSGGRWFKSSRPDQLIPKESACNAPDGNTLIFSFRFLGSQNLVIR